MWRNKKFLIIGVMVVIILAATVGGVTAAQADDENNGQAGDHLTALIEKVAEIYQTNTGNAIDAAELQKAFTQACQETRSGMMDNLFQKLVDNGKITQDQADQFKAWLDTRPAFSTEEFKQWLESRPDIPGLFGQANRGGMMPFSGMHNGKGGAGFRLGRCWSE